MKANRLDDIFQVKCGVPIIAGFYIGMEEDKAEELLGELTDYKTHHSGEYPADLIYNLKVSFRYELFQDSSGIVKYIEVKFPRGRWLDRFEEIKQYFSEKYYHIEISSKIEKDENDEITSFRIELYDLLYQYTIYSSGLKLMFELKAKHISSEIYCAVNTITQDKELKEFIEKSICVCNDFDKYHKDFAEVLPFNYGLPRFLGTGLGYDYTISEECGWLDDLNPDNFCFKGNPVCEDYDIGFEFTKSSYDCINSIIIHIPNDSEGVWSLLHYIRENFLIEEADYDIKYEFDKNYQIKKGNLNNRYISITIGKPYYAFDDSLYITISALDEDHPEKYRAMYIAFTNDLVISHLIGVKNFYKYRNPTQDARFNELRRKFSSFKAAADYYTAEHSAWARDMGGYSKEECEHDTAICLDQWNSPGSEGFPLSWIYVGLPDE